LYIINFVGLGLGIALTPSVMAISGYFSDPNQHRLAVGVAATGSSLGVAIFPLLIYHLEDIYAWKGVCILLVAVCAHLLPCGATIRPLKEVNSTRPRKWKNLLKIFEPVLFRSVAFNVLLLSNLFWSAGASIVVFFLPEYALSTGNNPSSALRKNLLTHATLTWCRQHRCIIRLCTCRFVIWLSGNALVVINTLLYAGPVNTGMGDCLRAGTPSRYVTSQLGQLSLLPSVGR